jgi:hypothetical protein
MSEKAINKYDAYGFSHGYWEWRFNINEDKKLFMKGNYFHGTQIGYWEHIINDTIYRKVYYI